MAKRLTTAERIRRYMETHPNEKPRHVASALGVKLQYVHTLRSVDKKKKALGLPIRRIKRNYTKRLELITRPRAPKLILEGMPKVGDSVGGLTLTRKALPDNTYAYTWVRDELVQSGKVKVDDMALPVTMEEPKADPVKADPVNHPAHYKVGGIETIDYIKAKLTPEEFRGYLKGNLLKYSSRIGHKGAAQIDAAKAGWYANALAQEIEARNA